jgi:hypothetical protein
LSFREQLSKTPEMKDDWSFIWDDAVRSNIAAALQEVHFDILLVNHYNVFWTPLSMKYKHALVQIASVVEAVLAYAVKMVESDSRVQEALGHKWNWIDFNDVPLGGRIEVPEGQRVVSGIQQKVQAVLDRNTKMKALILAAQKVGMLDSGLADKVDALRDVRNNIHIKALTAPEYDQYKPQAVNDALDLLELVRQTVFAWTVDLRKGSIASSASNTSSLGSADATIVVNDVVEHPTLGQGVVTASDTSTGIVRVRFFVDGTERRLMLPYAHLQKTGAVTPDDDIPF